MEEPSEPSSPESTTFDHTDLLNSSLCDDVTAQLAAAGPIGVAAAAAVATGKKRKRPHSFETNPSIRKRQQTRLLRKLKATIDEYTTRVGQQAVVMCVCPSKPNPVYKIFGAVPLETVVRNVKNIILQELDNALAQQTPQPNPENSGLYELPPLVIDGIPTPVDKMTQAQLRAFIPMMLKYSTGRGKPGWGKENMRPPWWPGDLPWQNVRSDCRSEEEKARVSWTNALRQIVKNCYKYHMREDLLPDFDASPVEVSTYQGNHHGQQMVHTIPNPDGTVSLIQVDASGAVSTITETIVTQTEATQAVATLAEVAAATQAEVVLPDGHHHQGTVQMTIDHNDLAHSEAAAQAAVATLAEATLADGGQIVLPEHAAAAAAALVSCNDGSLVNSSNMVTIPVQAATAMMQIQNLPVTLSTQQYFHSTVPQVAMAPHSIIHTSASGHQQEVHAHLVDSVDGVPVASQAVEVVTLENA